MLKFLAGSTRAVLAIFMALTNLFSFATGNKARRIAYAEPDCLMSFAAASDVHLQNYGLFEWLLDCGLLDVSRSKDMPDAFLSNGDNTNLGSEKEYERFVHALNSYKLPEQTFITMGNHDSWCGSWNGDVRTPEESIGRFSEYSTKISGIETDKPYYSSQVNGYPFIILGSEGNSTGAYISDEQLEWFSEQMAAAATADKPVFVFLHQPINGTHGLPYNWEKDENAPADEGGIGSESDAVEAIISQYSNVFYISGHVHAGFSVDESKNGYVSVERHGNNTYINVPSFSVGDFFQHGGCWQIGTGYVFEVYDSKVLIRARNFITGTWLAKYDQSIDLV